MECILYIKKKKHNLGAKLYTFVIRRQFACFGKRSYIFPPTLALGGLKRIWIGQQVSIGAHVQLTTWGEGQISIGDGCTIRPNCHITAVNHIHIGRNLLTGTNVLISDNSHGSFEKSQLKMHPEFRPLVSKGEVTIGDNVWLGNNVCVMPGVTIGDGVTIGANSVVTHDIPSDSMAAGVPAKIIKTLTSL